MIASWALFLSAMVAAFVVEGAAKCPEGWKPYKGSCYKLVEKLINYKSATATCRRMNADLAEINTVGESWYLVKTFGPILGDQQAWARIAAANGKDTVMITARIFNYGRIYNLGLIGIKRHEKKFFICERDYRALAKRKKTSKPDKKEEREERKRRYCPRGWSLRGSSCYKMVYASKRFGAARQMCVWMKSGLAELNSEGEMWYLLYKLGKTNVERWVNIPLMYMGKRSGDLNIKLIPVPNLPYRVGLFGIGPREKRAFVCEQPARERKLPLQRRERITDVEKEKRRAVKCPEGWKPYKGSCYKLIEKLINYKSATATCRRMDADLAEINTVGESWYLVKTFGPILGDQQAWARIAAANGTDTVMITARIFNYGRIYNLGLIGIKRHDKKFFICERDYRALARRKKTNKPDKKEEREERKRRYCPRGWSLRGSSCYKVVYESKRFGAARQMCVWMKSGLAELNSEGEMWYLLYKLGKTNVERWVNIPLMYMGKRSGDLNIKLIPVPNLPYRVGLFGIGPREKRAFVCEQPARERKVPLQRRERITGVEKEERKAVKEEEEKRKKKKEVEEEEEEERKKEKEEEKKKRKTEEEEKEKKKRKNEEEDEEEEKEKKKRKRKNKEEDEEEEEERKKEKEEEKKKRKTEEEEKAKKRKNEEEDEEEEKEKKKRKRKNKEEEEEEEEEEKKKRKRKNKEEEEEEEQEKKKRKRKNEEEEEDEEEEERKKKKEKEEEKEEERMKEKWRKKNNRKGDVENCGLGWMRNENACYKLFTEGRNFHEAHKACFKRNASLAELNSNPEINFLLKTYGPSRFKPWVKIVPRTGRRRPQKTIPTRLVHKDERNVGIFGNQPSNPKKKAAYICERESKKVCWEGWTKFEGRCYLYVRRKSRANEAERMCQWRNAHLASVNSEKEMKFLLRYVRPTRWFCGAWIGIHSKDMKTFKWFDHSSTTYKPPTRKADRNPRGGWFGLLNKWQRGRRDRRIRFQGIAYVSQRKREPFICERGVGIGSKREQKRPRHGRQWQRRGRRGRGRDRRRKRHRRRHRQHKHP